MRAHNGDLVADNALMKRFAAFFPKRKWTGKTRAVNIPQLPPQGGGPDYSETMLEDYDFFAPMTSSADVHTISQLSASVRNESDLLQGQHESQIYYAE